MGDEPRWNPSGRKNGAADAPSGRGRLIFMKGEDIHTGWSIYSDDNFIPHYSARFDSLETDKV
jgi:hypothetical protein